MGLASCREYDCSVPAAPEWLATVALDSASTVTFAKPLPDDMLLADHQPSAIICGVVAFTFSLVMQISGIYQEQSWIKIVLFQLKAMSDREVTSSSVGSAVSRLGLMWR
jgi:hypothetical protein